MSKYTPAVFQPTLRPSWAGAFEYIPTEELAKILKGIMCHVNLIPANPVKENTFKKPQMASILRFKERLIAKGINATVRRTLGADIDASCGQLRRKAKEVTLDANTQ
jgi:adenine C2-methylase RlmN of 23S rRNA A2503 and tRNA A37